MYVVKKVVKAMNKEKWKKRVENLALASTLGVAVGVVMTLFITPKYDSINNSFNKIKEKVLEVVETGKVRIVEFVD